MPSEHEIQDYLSRLVAHRASTLDLPDDDRECPICFEKYQDTVEYPVSVHSRHPRSTCRHIFGRKCLESHFRSGGPWCTRCPTCREEWFEHEEDEDDVSQDQESPTMSGATTPTSPSESVAIQIPQGIRFEILDEEMGIFQYVPQNYNWRHAPASLNTESGAEEAPLRVEARFVYVPEGPVSPNMVNESSSSDSDDGAAEERRLVESVGRSEDWAPGAVHVQPRYQYVPGGRPTGTSSNSSTDSEFELRAGHTAGAGRPGRLNVDNRGRVNRSIRFLERMLMTAEIDSADTDTNARVAELEEAIERLWLKLADSGREMDEALVAPVMEVTGQRARRVIYV